MKTIKKVEISYVFCHYIPELKDMEDNVIFISNEYKTSAHKCLCGCGQPVYLKKGDSEWMISIDIKGRISIVPSILNRFDCKSHYIITNNIAHFV